jgi:hypothetical protein
MQSITQTQIKIHNPNYPTLTALQPALDHLESFIDDETYGAICLLSKSHYHMILSRLGQTKMDTCILQHYAKNPTYPENLHISAKRELRRILGKEFYYEKHEEVFVESDLEYCVELHKQGKCIGLITPTRICIFCKGINDWNHDYDKCYREWYGNNIEGQWVPSYYNDNNNHNSTHCTRSKIHKGGCKSKDYYCGHSCPVLRHVCDCQNTKKMIFNFEYLYVEPKIDPIIL